RRVPEHQWQGKELQAPPGQQCWLRVREQEERPVSKQVLWRGSMELGKEEQMKRGQSWAVETVVIRSHPPRENNGEKQKENINKYLGNHAHYDALLLNVICLDSLVILKNLPYRE